MSPLEVLGSGVWDHWPQEEAGGGGWELTEEMALSTCYWMTHPLVKEIT